MKGMEKMETVKPVKITVPGQEARLGVISDLHGNRPALERTLERP